MGTLSYTQVISSAICEMQIDTEWDRIELSIFNYKDHSDPGGHIMCYTNVTH